MKNKILIPFVGDSVGGSHKSILEILDQLAELNVRFIILLHKKNGPLSVFLNEKKIKYDVLEIGKLSGEKPSIINILITNLINFLKLKKYLKKNKITLVHCNDLRTNLSWSLPSLVSGVPLIWHQRTLISNSYWWKIIKYITAKYIVTSEAIRIKSPQNIKNIKILANPINNIVDGKIINKKNIISDKEKIILGYCGRIVKEKSIEALIDSFNIIIKINTDKEYELQIAGRGEEKYINLLKKKLEKLNITNSVKFLGFVNNPYNFINNLDILICPSLIDGFGRTIIEAMSVKTIVIAASAGGHRHLINDGVNGFLYNSSKSKNLVLKILKISNNKNLEIQILKNALNYSKEFDNKKIALKLFDIYKELHSKNQFEQLHNILHIDIEGGWGGSSKSLFELVKVINNNVSNSSIIVGQKGKIINEYDKLNIENSFVNNLFSFVPRKKNSFKILIKNSIKLIYFPITVIRIFKIIKKGEYEIVHLNYEGLFLYGLFIKLFTRKKVIIHMRTLLPNNIFGDLVIFFISNLCANYVLFISKNEESRFYRKKNSNISGKILLNIFNSKNYINTSYHKKKYNITYLGNISFNKGVDRLLELARYIKKQNNNNYIIKVYGVARDDKNYFKMLLLNKKKGELSNIEFIDHTFDVAEILLNSFILIRPSRDNDPWGRDVIEAATSGLPVIATGSYNEIIKNNKNGFLIENFDCSKIYKYLEILRNDKDMWNNYNKYSIKYIREKYTGSHQKEIFKGVIEKLLK